MPKVICSVWGKCGEDLYYKVQLLYLKNLFCFFLFRTPTVRWGYVAMQFLQVNFFFNHLRFVD